MKTSESSKSQVQSAQPSALQVVYKPLESIRHREKNPRTHSQKQINQIAKSIKEFKFTNPVLIDEDDTLIAGHGRLKASKRLGIKEIPTICLSGLSEPQKRALVIADNRIAQNADWDSDLLAVELKFLDSVEVNFDTTITGFETAEIDLLIQPLDDEADDDEDFFPIDLSEEPITSLGDLWELGPHRVFCGDATKSASYSTLLGAKKASLVFTDPPYNVRVNGHISGHGKTKHPEFVVASGELSTEEFTNFLRQAFDNLIYYSIEGSIQFVCIDWRHLPEILTAGQVYSELKNLCVWTKDNAGLGSLYRSQHELILVFKNGSAPHINNVELGKFGRNRTNVWKYPGANSFHATRDEDLATHPTVKPLEMVKDAILDCSNRKDIVVDPFGGSGTTLMAADQTGRHAYLMELDPRYVDAILKRYTKATGVESVHAASGFSYSQLTLSRKNKSTTEVLPVQSEPKLNTNCIDDKRELDDD